MTPQELLGLTPKQGQVLQGIWRGLPDKLVADESNMSISTVRSHLKRIYAQLGVTNRVSAALAWERAITRNGEPIYHI